MRIRALIWPLAMLLAAPTATVAAGDAAAGKARAAVCGACHGADGNGTNPLWPKLAGQHAAYIVKQLEAFKSGARKDPLMGPQSASLSKQDMEDLAAYFASQPAK